MKNAFKKMKKNEGMSGSSEMDTGTTYGDNDNELP